MKYTVGLIFIRSKTASQIRSTKSDIVQHPFTQEIIGYNYKTLYAYKCTQT